MGQTNTKPETVEQHTPERERKRPSNDQDLTIKHQDTFDSHFTLISPMSDLSAPSQFLPKRHQYNEIARQSNVHAGMLNGHQNKSQVVIMDVPPLPSDLHRRHKTNELPPNELNLPLLNKKKKKKTRKSKQLNQIKQAFVGCAIVSAEHAEKMREATTKTMTACVKKTGEVMQDGAIKCGIAAKSAAAASADALVQTASNGCGKSQTKEDDNKFRNMSAAARDSLSDVNDSDYAVIQIQLPEQPITQTQPIWRESKGMIPMTHNQSEPNVAARDDKEVGDDATPLVKLDVAFAAAVGLHHEEAYFDRLARPSSSPSPFAKRERKEDIILPAETEDTPINVSLFSSESSIAKLETSDIDFAREVTQPKWQRMTDYEITPNTKSAPVHTHKAAQAKDEKSRTAQHKLKLAVNDQEVVRTNSQVKAEKRTMKTNPVQKPVVANHKVIPVDKQGNTFAKANNKVPIEAKAASRAAVQPNKQALGQNRNHPWVKQTKASDRSIFRQRAMLDAKASRQQVKSSIIEPQRSYGSLRVTESAPSLMQGRDYRSIALSTSEGAESAPARQYYTACSPSASSTCSNGDNSRGPLLTTQTISNAAFLFSPSYAGNDAELLKREQPIRDPAFSISTFAARARLTNVSSRSQPVITIPVSKSWDSSSKEEPEHDYVGVISLDETANNHKHVRFSDSYQTRYIDRLKKTTVPNVEPKRAVFNVPETITPPEIETKLSDLSDASILNRQVNPDEVSISTATSALTLRSEFREVSPTASSLDGSEQISPTMSATEQDSQRSSASCHASISSSKSNSSVHWTYREEDGKITATPNLDRTQPIREGVLATTSPMVRFRAAKEMFANPSEKAIPNKRTPPKKFLNRSPQKTLVASRITNLDARLKSGRQPDHKNPRRDTSGQRVLAPHRANLVNPNFRAPVTMKDTNEKKTEDSLSKLVLSNAESDNNTSMSIADTDVSDDPFAEIVKYNNYEPQIPGTLLLRPVGSGPITSVNKFGGNQDRSSVRQQSGLRPKENLGSASFDQESTVSLNYLHKMPIERGQVNPTDVYKHDNTANLCLSPTQRTPMQARKWRTLAAAAHENDKNKKSTVKRGNNKKAFSERSINVQ